MGRKADARSARTREDIKRALLVVLKGKSLAEASIAEVARAAGISRTTFYTHYGCLPDVYDELVLAFQRDIQTLHEHLDCVTCRKCQELVPLCEKVLHPGDYKPVLAEPQFMGTLFRVSKGTAMKDYEEKLMESGLSRLQAEAIVAFQTFGCISTAQSHLGKSGDWEDVKQALDAFIAGGLEAVGKMGERGWDSRVRAFRRPSA